jgi:hypothetical protein
MLYLCALGECERIWRPISSPLLNRYPYQNVAGCDVRHTRRSICGVRSTVQWNPRVVKKRPPCGARHAFGITRTDPPGLSELRSDQGNASIRCGRLNDRNLARDTAAAATATDQLVQHVAHRVVGAVPRYQRRERQVFGRPAVIAAERQVPIAERANGAIQYGRLGYSDPHRNTLIFILKC